MALSLRLDPLVEARIEQEAHRLGISKSDFVRDAIERVLGMKNPYDLLREARSGTPMGAVDTSEATGDRFKARLRAQRSA
ncbi:MAG: hypothetical protein FD187_2330 [bacterium]|jgi:RHH-type rel operon transcriptional repressor/antitoxin RelB|nr:MAG: hypothetical protein FD142_2442 [bacterium]KAF0148009.1 MAG: hypothetical protein FD187_2330 [bacterium]KAF0164885.1 MAG: hypothetical protein FD158_2986 [bacterium]TXT16900.1 MAG: hypothetical protein FD132_2652 [bacterium]